MIIIFVIINLTHSGRTGFSMTENNQLTSDISELVRQRRTIRSYATREVPDQLIKNLLQASADSVAAFPPELACRFRLITSQEGKEKLASLIMGTYAEQKVYKWVPGKIQQVMLDRIVKIPAFLAVILKKNGNSEQYDRSFAAICAMLQSFSLLSWEEKIGSVWTTDHFMLKPSFRAGMDLEEDEDVVSMLYLGYYEKIPRGKNRTPASKKLTFLQS
ncbi:hypothetical protein EBB07_11445 [Paenibacillaceae bacterium]|nr:hypothetical protein EBB07_11445 [Paenibacillaceae bacterium]